MSKTQKQATIYALTAYRYDFFEWRHTHAVSHSEKALEKLHATIPNAAQLIQTREHTIYKRRQWDHWAITEIPLITEDTP
jgi:hypothetical protein